MAFPITHIVLSNKVFPTYFSKKEAQKFYVGTSFPDIRYIGVVEREKTHFQNLSLSEVVSEDSFTSGLKFHSLVDNVREKFVIKNNIYDLMPKSPYVTQSLKFIEDEILYDHISDWQTYIDYFSVLLEEEKAFGISEESLDLWHKMIRTSLSSKPTPEGILEFVRIIGRPEKMSEEINKVVASIRDNKKIIEYVHSLYEDFENILLH